MNNDTAVTEPLFEPTDYNRKKNVERALITAVSSLVLRIARADEKLAELHSELSKARTALDDFYMLEPQKTDINGVLSDVAEIVNSGALDSEGTTVRVEVL